MSKKLTDLDFCTQATALKCKVEAIKAVAMVESGGRGGFDSQGRLLLRFEGHHFRKYTNGKYDRSNPKVSYPYSQQKSKPHGYSAFNEAFELDPIAAMLACSFGMFQVLGSHYDDMGFDDIHSFVDFMKESESNQLEIFVRFIRENNLTDELQKLNFAGFARVYNGASYKDFNYDVQMQTAYTSLSKKPIDCKKLLKEQTVSAAELVEDDSSLTEKTEADVQPPNSFQMPSIGAVLEKTKEASGQVRQGAEVLGQLQDLLPGKKSEDDPIKVTSGKKTSFFTQLFGIFISLLSAAIGFLKDNWLLIAVGIVGVVLIVIALSLVFAYINSLKMKIAADPGKHNVE